MKASKFNIDWNSRAGQLLQMLLTVTVFLLCTRTVKIYYIDYIPSVEAIYAKLSQVCTGLIVLAFLYRFRKLPKVMLVCLGAFYGFLFLATLTHGGNLRRAFGTAYPVLAMGAFVTMQCSTVDGAKRFLRTLTNLMLVLVGVNLTLMLLRPGMFGVTDTTNAKLFFLGHENQMGYSLMLGFFLVVINERLNAESWKMQLYALFFWLTALLNFSVGSLFGALPVVVYFLLPQIRRLFEKWDFWVFAAIVAAMFVVLVYWSEPIFALPPIRFILVDVLGKNITLTGRTEIWEVVTEAISKNPIWGHGMGENGNVFLITNWPGEVYISAHNQYLQSWYEGGMGTMLAFVAVLLVSSILLKKSPMRSIGADTKIFAMSLMVMMLVEAPAFNSLFFVLNLGAVLSLTLYREQTHLKNVTQNTPASEELVSVVIPVYNVEQFLPACLDSVLEQTHENLEILLVNDGSRDGSGQICEDYAARDSRIRLIHQENQGLSGARNTGIRAATGKYITFVDSDDAIHRDMVRYLLKLMQGHQADLSACQKQPIREDGTPIRDDSAALSRVLEGTDACMDALVRSGDLEVCAWGKLYRTEMFREVTYPLGKYHEDVFTTYRLAAQCSRIAIGSRKLYQYRQRGGSIMHESFSLKHLDGIEGYMQQLKFVRKHFPGLSIAAQARILWAVNSCAMRLARSDKRDEQVTAQLQQHYRRYTGAFLLGRSNAGAKLFALAAFVKLDALLGAMASVYGLRRKIRR